MEMRHVLTGEEPKEQTGSSYSQKSIKLGFSPCMLSFLLRNVLFKQFFDVIRKGPVFLVRKCNQLGLQCAIDLQRNGSVFHLTADSTT
jgi:hypothetical protein